MPPGEPIPRVSIILPARNEERFIGPAVDSVFTQEYPSGLLELIVAEGMSTDGTRAELQKLSEKYPNMQVIDNPKKIVPTGLNLAIRQAKGDFVIRMDAHCQYPKEYVRRLVTLLCNSGAACAGGALVAMGDANYAQTSIRLAYQSALSTGGSMRSYPDADFTRQIDSVHSGCWRKELLISIGCFDESMIRNQDDELSFRIRKQGGRILQDTSLRIQYHVRDSFRRLFNQFLQYGFWKIAVLRKHKAQANLRHIMPAVFVTVFVILALAGLFFAVAAKGLGLLAAIYGGSLLWTSSVIAYRSDALRYTPGMMLALTCMHFGYGIGFIVGAVRQLLGSDSPIRYFERLSR